MIRAKPYLVQGMVVSRACSPALTSTAIAMPSTIFPEEMATAVPVVTVGGPVDH